MPICVFAVFVISSLSTTVVEDFIASNVFNLKEGFSFDKMAKAFCCLAKASFSFSSALLSPPNLAAPLG